MIWTERTSRALYATLGCLIVAATMSMRLFADALEQTAVFVAGTDGYHTYRIPAMVTSTKGTVVAFCEGRKNSRSDTGDIDVVLKRSFDGGKTWQPMQLVADFGTDTIG